MTIFPIYGYLFVYLCIWPSWLIRFWFLSFTVWLLFIVSHRCKLFATECACAGSLSS